MSNRWLVKVSENGLHVFKKTFRTKKLAEKYCDKAAWPPNWSFELVDLKPRATEAK